MSLDPENALSASSAVQSGPAAVWSFNQMADYLASGYWSDQSAIAHHYGTITITYNLGNLTSAEQTLALSALGLWDDIANISFAAVAGTAQINFTHTGSATSASTNSAWGSAGSTTSSTVDVTQSWISAYGTSYDSYSFQTYIHEIGHALGLGHAGDYNGSATYGIDNNHANDTWQYSVMSYFSEANYGGSSNRYVVTPQMADIIAIGSIYGNSTTTRTGDTTYGFHATDGFYDFSHYTQAPALTLFDSGGNDTLDASGYSQSQMIDLQSGHYSSIGGLINNIGVATTTQIENAIGGSGNDTIIGNGGNNTLAGGAGGDYIDGSAGFNFASYSMASEAVSVDMAYRQYDSGEARGDTLVNIQAVVGSNFSDGLFGTDNNDVIYGGAGDDVIYGRGGNDSLLGTGGNDTIVGGAGNDTLYGDQGTGVDHDRFVFEAGNFGHDVIQGFGANDGANHDIIQMDHSHFATFADIMAHSGQFGTDVIIDSGTVSIQLVAVTLAQLTPDDFIIT
jgi:Ca2+-binding RTX toxin-like protein